MEQSEVKTQEQAQSTEKTGVTAPWNAIPSHHTISHVMVHS